MILSSIICYGQKAVRSATINRFTGQEFLFLDDIQFLCSSLSALMCQNTTVLLLQPATVLGHV